MAATIEWVIEELEGPETTDGIEIVNVDHAETYADALTAAAHLEHFRIGLVRDAGGPRGGRSWAYVRNHRLPAHFLDAYDREEAKTPRAYHRQIEKAVDPLTRLLADPRVDDLENEGMDDGRWMLGLARGWCFKPTAHEYDWTGSRSVGGRTRLEGARRALVILEEAEPTDLPYFNGGAGA